MEWYGVFFQNNLLKIYVIYLRQSWKPLRAALDITWALLDGTGIRETPLPNVTTLPPLKPLKNVAMVFCNAQC